MKIRGFEWDGGNKEKCQKHGVSTEEIEEFFLSGNFIVGPDLKHSSHEKRYLAVGKGKYGKPIFVVYIERNNLIRPVSARYMHQKEWKIYEKKDSAF